MTNPLAALWSNFISHSRYGFNPNLQAYQALPPEVVFFVMGTLYSYQAFDYSTAKRLLDSNSIHPTFRYRRFSVPKKDGSLRQLVEPDDKLKQVQKQILKRLLNQQSPNRSAVGYRKKKSTADHVWAHAGADLIITADIEDFFPNTKAWRVEQWWQAQYEGDQIARLLTLLTTYQGGLPQGASTSPALSNLVNVPLDTALYHRAETAGGNYTRYCDDMVFSWRNSNQPPSDFEHGVRATLSEYGYNLNAEKGWRVYERSDEPEITGAILTKQGKIALPDHIRQKMRQLARSRNPYDAQRLEGYHAYESMLKNKPKPPNALSRTKQAQQVRASQVGIASTPAGYDDDDEYDDDDD